ncbi:hypothetical protein CYMTET_42486 [Cymbomonas tetramitiformis]|uniref:F-box domain-containing protein n=1 Tax=Cymbomonas tetramitiformis TaxID=36881 RepID=A0AAE0F175_9CHLO|nr:hypothetical protein CYMTET_42488 [Cymbomonas tetramitiformis]KAK3248036.1 hypothetical protein CYMTET_42486 [Cymbomonas tetramitiformis]
MLFGSMGEERPKTRLRFADLPEECRLSIISHLSQQDLYCRYAVASKQCRHDSLNADLPQGKMAILHGSCSVYNLMDQLHSHQHAFTYERCTLKLVQHGGMLKSKMPDLKYMLKSLKLPHVTKLDLSFPLPRKSLKACQIPSVLPKVLGMVMPNLQEVNLNGVSSDLSSSLTALFKSCPINTFHFNDMGASWFHITGAWIQTCAVCLKDLQLDGIVFYGFSWRLGFEIEFGRDGSLHHSIPKESIILIHCKSHLERVSLIAPKVSNKHNHFQEVERIEEVPESAIMLFVRGLPNLQWFRSSLSAPNIDKLRAERPEVCFVNEHDEEWI